MGRQIPLSIPNFEGNERKYVEDALAQGWVSTGGAYIERLEGDLARFLRVEDVAACQSGTAALHMALRECGVLPGDMVIVPTLTFIAAVNPVRYQLAEPAFLDCDGSLCMDPEKLRDFCERECGMEGGVLTHRATGRRVRAIVVVHVFGNLADMEVIMDIATEYGLKVVEDATEALGSYFEKGRYAGRYAGTIGDFGAFSFNGNKIITTGGGGAVTARDPGAVAHMRYLSTQAKDDASWYVHDEVGYNYRMTNLQAAIGVAQMEELPEFLSRKRRNYERYAKEWEDLRLGRLFRFREGTYPNCWFYALEISMEKISKERISVEKFSTERVSKEKFSTEGITTERIGPSLGEVMGRLAEAGIQTRPIWGLIHEQLPYRECVAYRIERAPWFRERVLCLPCSTQITEDEIQYVAGKVREILEGGA